MVIGTVKGDIHDIGKNLVSMMLEGAGFEVIDLGINNPVEKYLAAIELHQPDILGLSALLTTTMPYMKVVIDTLKEKGIRDKLIVLVGGAPLNEEFGKAIGADAYCRDAAIAVETAKSMVAARRAAREKGQDCSVQPSTRALVIACGALAREITALKRASGWAALDVSCLPPELHNRPERIPAAVRAAIIEARARYQQIFVAYADCGTGGALDRVLAEEGVERLPGAHCYEFFATSGVFAALAEAEPGTFYLTDFLVRHFQRLVLVGLGIERHPQLAHEYFRNYRRVIYLAQTADAQLERDARAIAARLGLSYEQRATGYGDLASSLTRLVRGTGIGVVVEQSPGRP
jgi:methylmalonyl-CoA mutase cobalamin-binding domain/chain